MAIDIESIPEATERANLPLFLAITAFDKLVFFIVWGLLQARVIRQYLAHAPVGQIMAVKGASELIRSINNSLSDAAFFFGTWQLTGRPLAVVVAVVFIVDVVAGAALSRAFGTAALGHEIRQHAVKHDPVIEAFFDEADEITDRLRRLVLEQLRALENGIEILVFDAPDEAHGVDTPEDLEKVARMMQNQKENQ